ncbi:hypothetical protein C8R44DRAFT_846016 [Mycena epipterygia]|nr:hypothetical protein C8R44DRAFT_846016 [Mycena epipterygia]
MASIFLLHIDIRTTLALPTCIHEPQNRQDLCLTTLRLRFYPGECDFAIRTLRLGAALVDVAAHRPFIPERKEQIRVLRPMFKFLLGPVRGDGLADAVVRRRNLAVSDPADGSLLGCKDDRLSCHGHQQKWESSLFPDGLGIHVPSLMVSARGCKAAKGNTITVWVSPTAHSGQQGFVRMAQTSNTSLIPAEIISRIPQLGIAPPNSFALYIDLVRVAKFHIVFHFTPISDGIGRFFRNLSPSTFSMSPDGLHFKPSQDSPSIDKILFKTQATQNCKLGYQDN